MRTILTVILALVALVGIGQSKKPKTSKSIKLTNDTIWLNKGDEPVSQQLNLVMHDSLVFHTIPIGQWYARSDDYKILKVNIKHLEKINDSTYRIIPDTSIITPSIGWQDMAPKQLIKKP